MSILTSPLALGAVTIPNRIVMAPLTRARAGDARVPTDLMAEYYRQRAGAGLILSEATCVSPRGVGYHGTPGIWNDEQVAGWRKVTSAVHDEGGTIFLQLWHVGRISDPELLDGDLPVAPSAVRPPGRVSRLRPVREYVTPRALATDEVPGIVEDYRRGSELALQAGFDGVEIHGANGYLVQQFLHDSTNLRTDRYGGGIENRARFLLEITDAVAGVWGADRVGVHLSPYRVGHAFGDTDPAALYGHVAAELGERGLAFLFVREVEGPGSLLADLKEQFSGPVIANDEMGIDDGRRLIESGHADAISFGRDYIATPDLAERVAVGAPFNTPVPATFYPDGVTDPAVGYTDYPSLDELRSA